MSTARLVPETYEMTGDDAVDTLRQVGTTAVLKDSVKRLRYADGMSHGRATGFQLVLTLIPGAIALVALAKHLQWESLSNAIVHTTESVAPGPASDVFRQAFEQGTQNGSPLTALAVGGLAMLISGTTAFGQIERTANRLYGVEQDRPSLRKYGRALAMTLTAGTLCLLYFLVIGMGDGWSDSDSIWWTLWSFARWPVGGLVLAAAFALIFRYSPRRRQPAFSWLLLGAAISVVGTLAVSILLHLYLNASGSFGETYGPLAGFIGVLLWAYLSAVTVFFGLAVAAQLEACRAGVPTPQSEAKVLDSDPDAEQLPYGSALRASADDEHLVASGAPGAR